VLGGFFLFGGSLLRGEEVVVWACVSSKLRWFSLRWISLCDEMNAMQRL